MDKEKYIFVDIYLSEYKADPVFGSEVFAVFGNPQKTDDPLLFEVYINPRRFRYCLINPKETAENKELLLKIRRYLSLHEDNNDLENPVNTYFIGNMEKSIEVSDGFINQNIILVTNEMIEQWYPTTLKQIFEIVIRHVLKHQKYLGEHHFFLQLNDDILFVNPELTDLEKRNYKLFLLKCMAEEGLVSIIQNGTFLDYYDLTAKGIASVQNVEEDKNKIAFIAIKFDGNEERINVIQNAISEAGFEPQIMNNVETNNWIMPEIFHNIANARFVVADFSVKCDGAYYEAGYAAALNKPVIHLFDKREDREDNKLHFDIAQKSTIFYKDFDDLKKRLIDRIKATIK